MIDRKKYTTRMESLHLYHKAGKITKTLGGIFEAHLPGAAVGSLCKILKTKSDTHENATEAEVIGFRDKNIVLMPFEHVQGVNNDTLVVLDRSESTIRVGDHLLGRVLDGRGIPMDGLEILDEKRIRGEERSLYHKPTHVMKRSLIEEPLAVGIRSIDGLLSCGRGQRVGIFAGSGVGKSVLLGMIARNTEADVNVIALIGERGREVREFIERDLGEGLKRSVIVLATSDQSPLLRMRAAFIATSIAEYFRDQGLNVLFLMDSITRFSMAQREIGLSLGEPPATKGYTPSVFSTLPRLLERAGTREGKGSITGLYTVLVEGDEMDDPIADAARSYLDGHIVLSRKLAERNHYPAVDILQSASRVMPAVVTKDQREYAGQIREWLSLYAQVEDLINIGAYVKGANPKIDVAVEMNGRIMSFLRQKIGEGSSFQDTSAAIKGLVHSGQVLYQRYSQTQAERGGSTAARPATRL